MAYTTPTVNYATTYSGTYTTLTGVQSITINRGRDYYQDNIKQSVCIVELIPSTSYATALAIGQFIDVRDTNTTTSRAYFCGRITDVRRDYAIPYTSATSYAPGDRITITATGTTGLAAQNTLTDTTGYSATTAFAQAAETLNLASINYVGSDSSAVPTSLTTPPQQSALDICNALIRTGQFLLDDYDGNRANGYNDLINLYRSTINNKTFTDSGVGIKYTNLTFQSSAQSTFNKVNVLASGLAAQTAQAGSGTKNSLDYTTYNKTTAEALNLANYLYNLFNAQTTIGPYQITTNTMVDGSCLDVSTVSSKEGLKPWIGAGLTITFRGTTYTAQIQQIQTNFYPDFAQVLITCAPSLGTAFTLDSAAFGVLNTNRLGYP